MTGGAGFIGSHLVEKLVQKGHKVRVFDNFSTGREKNLAACKRHVKIIPADLRDLPALRRAMKGVETVFHQAAMVSVQESQKNPKKAYETNVLGTFNTFHAAVQEGVRQVIYASSCAAASPISFYGESKKINEWTAALFNHHFGLRTVGLRYFNVFGPRQNPDSPYSGVISIFLEKFRNSERPVIFGDGRQTRDFIYVEDVVQANWLASRKKNAGGQVLNVGTGRKTSLNELVAILKELFHKDLQPRYAKARAGDIRHSRADMNQTKAHLSFTAQYSLKRALKQIL